MRVITWNIRRATETSDAWRILIDLNPDIALLQEVSSIPKNIMELFDIKFRRAVGDTGMLQQFSTAIIVKGKIINELPLSSEYDWVNQLLEYFTGNLVSCIVQPIGYPILNIVSVYSPAWPINQSKHQGIDISTIKLKQKQNLWVTEILWSALKNANLVDVPWIVGGDLNSSETFDVEWQKKNGVRFGLRSCGNKEVLDRIDNLGFKECLRKYNNKIVPTFKHSKGGIDHQIDHLFVTNNLYLRIQRCTVADQSTIFGKSLTDHLPIIADFKDI